jgi:hypothetical protein
MPVAPGRNVAILVGRGSKPVAQTSGHHSARRLVERVNRGLELPAVDVDADVEPGEDL